MIVVAAWATFVALVFLAAYLSDCNCPDCARRR